MYAVIFKAEVNQLDDEYYLTALRMRDIAIEEFGCKEFVSSNENNTEVAISYWDTLKQIQAWKQHPEHQAAQEQGKNRWYKSYQIEIVEVIRSYQG